MMILSFYFLEFERQLTVAILVAFCQNKIPGTFSFFLDAKIKNLIGVLGWPVGFLYQSPIDFIAYDSLQRHSKLFCGEHCCKNSMHNLKLKCFDFLGVEVGRAEMIIWFSITTIFKMGNFKSWIANDSGWLRLILHSSLELTRSGYGVRMKS